MATSPLPNPTRIDADALIALRAAAERLRPPPAAVARAPLVGTHRSRLRGRGMDYRESRHYEPGDDIRTMDWRITARAGRPHVKVFDEERERPVVVLVDLGPSMCFASRGVFKAVQAARLAALIGWFAVGRGDRIGALVFAGGGLGPGDALAVGPPDRPGLPAGTDGHLELSPTAGRRGQMRLIRALVAAGAAAVPGPGPKPGPAADAPPAAPLTIALARLRRVARPGSLVFLLSDFYGRDGDTERHLTRLARHNELIALQIIDALERAPPPPGRYPISDGERRALLDTRTATARTRYAAHFAAHHAAVRRLTEGNGVPLIEVATDAEPAERLAVAFAARGRVPRGASMVNGTASDGWPG